jgi:hypothetical protein
MSSKTEPVALNASQLRAVGAMLGLVEEAVDQIERLLIAPVIGITSRLADDLDSQERRVIHAACKRARAALIQACNRLEIETAHLSRRGAIRGEVSTLWAMLEDIKSPGLRGYGPLSPDAGRVVDGLLDEISGALIGILRLIA